MFDAGRTVPISIVLSRKDSRVHNLRWVLFWVNFNFGSYFWFEAKWMNLCGAGSTQWAMQRWLMAFHLWSQRKVLTTIYGSARNVEYVRKSHLIGVAFKCDDNDDDDDERKAIHIRTMSKRTRKLRPEWTENRLASYMSMRDAKQNKHAYRTMLNNWTIKVKMRNPLTLQWHSRH